MSISDLASIATLLLFVAYIIGRAFRIHQMKETLTEKYQFEKDFDLDGPKTMPYLELVKDGAVFSVCSPVGIKQLRAYKAIVLPYQCEAIKGDNIGELKDIKPNEKAFIKVDIPDLYEGCFIDIEKKDGVKISFGIATSGYDNSLIQTHYSLKMTLKSWIYYICI